MGARGPEKMGAQRGSVIPSGQDQADIPMWHRSHLLFPAGLPRPLRTSFGGMFSRNSKCWRGGTSCPCAHRAGATIARARMASGPRVNAQRRCHYAATRTSQRVSANTSEQPFEAFGAAVSLAP